MCVCECAGAFEDEDIIHVEGCVDPVRDIEIIHEELRMKDEEMIGPIIDKLEKTAVRGGDKKLKPEYVSEQLFTLVILFGSSRSKFNSTHSKHKYDTNVFGNVFLNFLLYMSNKSSFLFLTGHYV